MLILHCVCAATCAGPQLLSYSRFLNDTRSAPRLLAGLAGLAAYSALHAATPLTGGP